MAGTEDERHWSDQTAFNGVRDKIGRFNEEARKIRHDVGILSLSNCTLKARVHHGKGLKTHIQHINKGWQTIRYILDRNGYVLSVL